MLDTSLFLTPVDTWTILMTFAVIGLVLSRSADHRRIRRLAEAVDEIDFRTHDHRDV